MIKTIRNYIAEHPNCTFIDIAQGSGVTGSTPCGEIWRVLRDLADPDASDDVAILIEGEENRETFRLRPGAECHAECIQDMTVNCYETLYDRSGDSREVLSTIRGWADDFFKWWWNLPESEREERGYMESIDAFAERKLHKDEYTRDTNLQEFTASAVNHAVGAYDHMSNVLNMSRPQAFLEIQKWADEFWDQYKDHKYIGEESYYDLVDKFLLKKMSQMREA